MRLPTIDETIADVLRAPKTASAAPLAECRDGLRKLAAAARNAPAREVTFEDLYTVKRAFYGA
jgi:hypothetical protein